MGEVARVLARGGVFVANLVDQVPFARVRSLVAAARTIGPVVVGAEPPTVKGAGPATFWWPAAALPRSAFGSPSPQEYRIFEGWSVRDSFGA